MYSEEYIFIYVYLCIVSFTGILGKLHRLNRHINVVIDKLLTVFIVINFRNNIMNSCFMEFSVSLINIEHLRI